MIEVVEALAAGDVLARNTIELVEVLVFDVDVDVPYSSSLSSSTSSSSRTIKSAYQARPLSEISSVNDIFKISHVLSV